METVLSILAILLSVISGVFAFYTFTWTARRDRKQATLDAYNRVQTEVFDNINVYPVAKIKEICLDTHSEDYKTLSAYLARIEHFCVGLNEGIYDKDTFYSLAHGYFDGYLLRSRIEPILESKNRNSSEIFYNDIIRTLQWMDKKKV